ncbi:MAG: glycosyltransferase family 9 protein [Planctomycetes bacterium]|nr:glycosyltransferase family 9 protein [Planctomycetota bacterium]
MTRPLRILLIRLSALGDVINTLPVLEELRAVFPSARIAWLVEPEAAPVVEAQPALNEAIRLPRKRWQRSLGRPSEWAGVMADARDVFARLREARFDIALDLQGNFRSALALGLSAARRRVSFHPADRPEWDLGLATERLPRLPFPCHRVEKALHLLRALGIEPGQPRARLPIPQASFERVDAFLGGLGLGTRPLAVLHPGTSRFGAYKQWTDEGYRALARRLVLELGLGVLFTWSGEERQHVARLAAGLPPAARVSFETDLMDLAALCRRARLFVGADTGPGHLASLVGTPVVSIFGPKHPALYRPYFSPCWVVERDRWCRPCVTRTCSAPVCLSDITVGQVFQTVCLALRGGRPLPVVNKIHDHSG